MTFKQTGNKLTITIDLDGLDVDALPLSSSGKTKVIASTHGNMRIPLKLNGKDVNASIGMNMFTKDGIGR